MKQEQKDKPVKKSKPSKTVDDIFNEKINLSDRTFKGWEEGEFEMVMDWLLRKTNKKKIL